MWSYYGAKTNIVDLYPKPKHGKIIEPFAGSARYALKYFDREVLLVDKYEVIVKIWKWLKLCSPNDILTLPRSFKLGQTLNDFTFDCEEAKLLMGFIIKGGNQSPVIKPSKRRVVNRPNGINYSIKQIASNLFKIKHWEIMHDSYENIPNEEATWFIDPPYQFGGHAYVMNNRKLNFSQLSEWCKNRQGQIIVCESNKADWMDFIPMQKQYGTTGAQNEVIWSNEKTAFDNVQMELYK